MPSIFTHSLVGLVAGKILSPVISSKRFWVLSIIYPSLPDADVLGTAFGIPHEHLLGHRGLTHSILFALIVGLITAVFFFRKENRSTKRTFILACYFALITMSHGILDGLNNGGIGVAYFSPLSNTRYFFPFRPIEVSPIGLAFFGERGFVVFQSELIWVWAPLLSTLIIYSFIRNKLRN